MFPTKALRTSEKRLTCGYLKGETAPQERYVQSNPKASTAHPNYVWLNRLFCLGIGKIAADVSEIIYDMYAVR